MVARNREDGNCDAQFLEDAGDRVCEVRLALVRRAGVVDVPEMHDGVRLVVLDQVREQRHGVGHPRAPVADDADLPVVRDLPLDDTEVVRAGRYVVEGAAVLGPVSGIDSRTFEEVRILVAERDVLEHELLFVVRASLGSSLRDVEGQAREVDVARVGIGRIGGKLRAPRRFGVVPPA